MNAAVLPDETKRLAAVRQYAIPAEIPVPAIDDLTLLAAQVCTTPMAMVSFVDERRQWLRSPVGLVAGGTPREVAFCAHVIFDPDKVFAVQDASADARFAQNPFVQEAPHLRFYAGAPLVAPGGEVLGALCVMDQRPRTLTPEQASALQALSRQVVAQLELRQLGVQLATREEESQRLLDLAGKSRRALLGILEDEKRSGQSLRTSETRFRELAENIQEVFWITEPSSQAILYVSPAYEKIYGRTCQSLYETPETWEDAIHPEDRARVKEAARTKQPAGTYDETFRLLHSNGSIRWVRDRAFPVRDGDGRVLRVVGTTQDITEYRQLEAQYRQAQKMEAIGALAGGIAHDFNNILGAIMGYAELTRMKLDDPGAAKAHLASLLRGITRAKSLVEQILTFSRQREQKLGLVQLRHIIKEPLELLQATIPATIEFNVHLATQLPAVMADATQIHQVVMNLCTNAWHAMRDRPGRLEVRLDAFTVSEASAAATADLQPGPHLRLTVSDTGHGMSRSTLDRIFEPFFTTKAPGEGTGLGLSVVHGIMRSHGGAITVDSEVGKGTTFHLYFPIQARAAEELIRKEEEIPHGAGQRILLVDNEHALVKLGRDMLEELGYRVTMATSAMEALQAVAGASHYFDLLITDLTMPMMTGTDLAARVRQLRPDLPILLATGQPDAVSASLMAELGIRECMPKPISFVQLATCVHRALLEA